MAATQSSARSNPLRADPSRTALLRRQFEAEMKRRFRRIKQAILDLLIKEDAFGLRPRNRLLGNSRWIDLQDPDKIEQFNNWLRIQIQQELLETVTGTKDEPWLSKYIGLAHKKGVDRTYKQVKPVRQDPEYEGARRQFLESSFLRPVSTDRVRMIYVRAITSLRGVSEQMASAVAHSLSEGLVAGRSPREIGEELAARVDKTVSQATRIARTETVAAHAEGQLDALEELGMDEVGVAVEWDDAGDDRVCPLCKPLDGIVLSIAEARGLLPRHPNCRCAFIPANVGESTKGQKRSAARIKAAIERSLKAERPKRRKGTAQSRRSSWAGAKQKINKRRPKSIV